MSSFWSLGQEFVARAAAASNMAAADVTNHSNELHGLSAAMRGTAYL